MINPTVIIAVVGMILLFILLLIKKDSFKFMLGKIGFDFGGSKTIDYSSFDVTKLTELPGNCKRCRKATYEFTRIRWKKIHEKREMCSDEQRRIVDSHIGPIRNDYIQAFKVLIRQCKDDIYKTESRNPEILNAVIYTHVLSEMISRKLRGMIHQNHIARIENEKWPRIKEIMMTQIKTEAITYRDSNIKDTSLNIEDYEAFDKDQWIKNIDPKIDSMLEAIRKVAIECEKDIVDLKNNFDKSIYETDIDKLTF
jgi:hypothetical protein